MYGKLTKYVLKDTQKVQKDDWTFGSNTSKRYGKVTEYAV